MTVDELPRSEAFRDSPHVRLAKAHERRSAVRALAGLARNRTDFEVLADMLDLDPADGRADLPPVTLTPALPAPPAEPEPVDLMPAGLRNLAPVSAPISPPRETKQKITPARHSTTPAPAPADGICPADDCTRPYKHRGIHGKARIDRPRPADGICETPGCDRPWKHGGRHIQPKTKKPTPADVATAYDQAAEHVEKAAAASPGPARKWSNAEPTGAHRGRQPNPFDPAEAARRYLEGEPLFTLAGELRIGVATLRRALQDQGVQLRKRGEVITPRDSHARPIDPELVRRLYADGALNTVQIAGQLHVKTSRIQDLLRQQGLLRPPGGKPPGAGAINSVRLNLGPDLTAQVRLRASSLGKPINHYLRDLVLADLIADVHTRDASTS